MSRKGRASSILVRGTKHVLEDDLLVIELIFCGGNETIHKVRNTRYQEVEISLTGFALNIGSWCNGNTRDFGSLIPGSNPSDPTIKRIQWLKLNSGKTCKLDCKTKCTIKSWSWM